MPNNLPLNDIGGIIQFPSLFLLALPTACILSISSKNLNVLYIPYIIDMLVTTSGNMSKLAFNCTKEALGIDSIIFGSDYPYENLADMMKFMDSLDLTAEEKEKVFYKNAEKYIL